MRTRSFLFGCVVLVACGGTTENKSLSGRLNAEPSTENGGSGGDTSIAPVGNGGAEPTVVAPGGSPGEPGGSAGAGTPTPVEPVEPPPVGAGGSAPVAPESGGQAGAAPVEPDPPPPDAGTPVVEPPTPRACDYPSLGVEHMGVNTPEFVLWSTNDIGRALRALVVAFPSTPPGCAGAEIDASGDVIRADIDSCPVTVAGQAFVVSGQLEVETTRSFNPGQYPDFISSQSDRRVVRGQAPESTLTFAGASGGASFSITSFEFSGESSSTAARLDSIAWGAVARYTDAGSCRSFDVSLSATELNPSSAMSSYVVAANMVDGAAGFRFPEARLVGDNPSAYVFITLADGSPSLRLLNHAALFGDEAPYRIRASSVSRAALVRLTAAHHKVLRP